MDLSIVIVSLNTKDILKKCLESIKNLKLEIIVIDNASTDGSTEMVKKEFSDKGGLASGWSKVKLIENEKNLGYARANNQGIKIAKRRYIFLLNSDTQIKTRSFEKLVKFTKDNSQAGVVGAKLVNLDGSVQASVYYFPTIWRAIKEYWLGQKGAYEKYAPKGKKPVEVEAVTGAAMLISRKTIEKIGLLDERYFMYFEDLDYCRRVRKAGLKVYYLPKAEIIHHHGKSAQKAGGKAYQYLSQSSKIFNGIVKHYFLFLILWMGQKWQELLDDLKRNKSKCS
jgi:GT2 family glycosyltransferase